MLRIEPFANQTVRRNVLGSYQCLMLAIGPSYCSAFQPHALRIGVGAVAIQPLFSPSQYIRLPLPNLDLFSANGMLLLKKQDLALESFHLEPAVKQGLRLPMEGGRACSLNCISSGGGRIKFKIKVELLPIIRQ